MIPEHKEKKSDGVVTVLSIIIVTVVVCWLISAITQPAGPAALNPNDPSVLEMQQTIVELRDMIELPPGERELKAWEEGAMAGTSAIRVAMEERLTKLENKKPTPGPKGPKGDPGERGRDCNVPHPKWFERTDKLTSEMFADIRDHEERLKVLEGDCPSTIPGRILDTSGTFEGVDLDEDGEVTGDEAIVVAVSSIGSTEITEVDEIITKDESTLDRELMLLWRHIRQMAYCHFGALPIDKPKGEHDEEGEHIVFPVTNEDKMPWDRESFEEINNTPAPPEPPVTKEEKSCHKKPKYKNKRQCRHTHQRCSQP